MSEPGELLAQRIRREFPDLAWKEHRYVDVGVDHQVIILDERWVFRIPRNHPDDLENEIQLLGYLSGRVRAGIPVYEYWSTDQCLAGYAFLPGVDLSRSVFQDMPPSKRKILSDQLADLLTDLHSIPPEDMSSFNVEEGDRPTLDLETSMHLLTKLFGSTVAPAVSKFVRHFNAGFESDKPKVFLHGELTADHILWDDERSRVNTIDISACFVGDPAHDFSELWAYGAEFIHQVYRRYGGPKDSRLLDRAALLYKAMPISALDYWVSEGREVPPSTVSLFEDRWPEVT